MKRFAFLLGLLPALCLGQAAGPTTLTPKLHVTGALTVDGGCTGCGAAGGGVTKIVAGTGVSISPTNGLGDVTVNASGGGGGALGSAYVVMNGTDPAPLIFPVSGSVWTVNQAVVGVINIDTDIAYDDTTQMAVAHINTTGNDGTGNQYFISYSASTNAGKLRLQVAVSLPGGVTGADITFAVSVVSLVVTCTMDCG